jgi:hypothetical protein
VVENIIGFQNETTTLKHSASIDKRLGVDKKIAACSPGESKSR